MNSAQYCGVSQYTTAKGSSSSSMTVTAGTNQLLPSNVMTSATSAVGYSNGILYLEHDAIAINTVAQDEHYNTNESTNNHHRHNHNNNNKLINGGGDDDDDTDSFASMETLSDNVSIWVDGEKHWISGVDANTTCGDLICALLNYQDGPQMFDASANDNAGSAASNTNNNHNSDTKHTKNNNGNNAINQSTTNTKEDCKAIAATTNSLLSEYVIVKQHRHCEEYLDGSTKVFDVLPPPLRDGPARKECELLLRHLASPSPRIATQVSSLLSTDKDSGMGSPGPIVDGSTRSSKFRRRKHKSSNWLAQGNTLHPKLSQRSNTANERLLKIILAQDETIHRQLSMLREKERQISKIEVEKHRVRQRELGKNYLLETYLNGLDVAEAEPEVEVAEDGVEIFIDEPYYRLPAKATTKTTTTTKKTTTTTTSTQKWSLLHRQRAGKQRKDEDCCTAPKTSATDEGDEKQTPSTAAAANVASAATLGGNQKEIELQILWLEKVYSINKQLQREEELLLKLHAKIRKHQVKRAYQTKKDVIQQIDKLDSELALQCADIRQVEYSLVTSSEQLEQKLCILEKLSQEFQMEQMATEQPPSAPIEISIQPAAASIDADDDNVVDSGKNASNKQLTTATTTQSLGMCNQHQQPQPLPQLENGNCITMDNEKHVSDDAQLTGEVLYAIHTPQKLNFSQMHSPEDLLNLQKLIAKPTQATAMQSPLQPTAMAEQPASSLLSSASTSLKSSLMQTTVAATSLHHQGGMLQHNNNYPISRHNHPHRGSNAAESHPSSSCTPQQLIDKNSLLLHVNNAKTVKKQMFGPKSLNQAMVVAAAPSTATATIQAAIIHSETTSSKNYDTPTPLDDITRMGTLV